MPKQNIQSILLVQKYLLCTHLFMNSKWVSRNDGWFASVNKNRKSSY